MPKYLPVPNGTGIDCSTCLVYLDDVIIYSRTVSKEHIPTTLIALHDHSTVGHLRIAKTLPKVRSRFYWPRKRRDVEDWCQACDDCASQKQLRKPHCAPLQCDLPGVPLQRVGMDILGPLPVSDRGYKYILVISDYGQKLFLC